LPYESGTPVTAYLPRGALRVLGESGTPVMAGGLADDDGA
jgi:hypothetical protein